MAVECEGVIVTQEGKVVCKDTGEVISEDIIQEGPEWRVFRDQNTVKGLERAGDPLTFTRHDMGVEAYLTRRGRLASGEGRPGYSLKTARVLKEERPLVDMLNRANTLCDSLGLPRVAKETVGLIIRLYMEKVRSVNEREKDQIVAAAVAKAIEIHNLSIPLNSILQAAGITQEALWAAKRKLVEAKVIDDVKRIAMPNAYQSGHRRLLNRVLTYIIKIQSELNLPNIVYVTAVKFLEEALKAGKNLYGKRPESVAAAAVYLAARLHGFDNINQRVLAKIVNIKESNVRKLYKYLLENMVVIVAL